MLYFAPLRSRLLLVLSKHGNIPSLPLICPERKFNFESIFKRRQTQHLHRPLLKPKRTLIQKYIRPALPLDKAKSFGRIEPNHFPFQPFHHVTNLPFKQAAFIKKP